MLQLIQGDCFSSLGAIPDDSIHCCVTSPPYFGLRDYGHENQFGLENTPARYVERLVQLFEEVKRVLRPDGTVWLNLGDSYAGSGRGGKPTEGSSTLQGGQDTQKSAMITRRPRLGAKHGDAGHTSYKPVPNGSCLPAGFHESAVSAGVIGRRWVKPPGGFKQKDLIGIPWRVAFALQGAGWYLRQDIIWSKPNPMPESVTDRCTKSHEYIFLLTKSKRYFFDAEAIAEAAIYGSDTGASQAAYEGTPGKPQRGLKPGRKSKLRGEFNGKTNTMPGREAFRAITETRNKRSVWTVPSSPYKEAHFATFPANLIRPMILAGCPAGGMVLDPFAGSGTTGKVALELGRRALLIELNPDYCALIRQRCTTTMGLGI